MLAPLKARPMNTPRHTIARSAFGAAWSMALGMGGVAGKRLRARPGADLASLSSSIEGR